MWTPISSEEISYRRTGTSLHIRVVCFAQKDAQTESGYKAVE
jgi:hypothetical protein